MREKLLKAYESVKRDIDRWLGNANMLALILEHNFGEDTKEERIHMEQIKNYLKYDFLENLEVDRILTEIAGNGGLRNI